MSLKAKLLPPKHRFYTDVAQDQFDDWYATHVEPLFANAVEVVGGVDPDGHHAFDSTQGPTDDTHRALLIGVELIEKGVTVEEIVDQLRTYKFADGGFELLENLANRIEREGVKNG